MRPSQRGYYRLSLVAAMRTGFITGNSLEMACEQLAETRDQELSCHDVERKSWMPAFAGMTWGGWWVKARAVWYDNNQFGLWLTASGRDVERKLWMPVPAFSGMTAGMTWDGRYRLGGGGEWLLDGDG